MNKDDYEKVDEFDISGRIYKNGGGGAAYVGASATV